MAVALLSIGTELTRGEIVDTNSAWLSSSLTEAGFEVTCSVTVPDDKQRLIDTLRRLGDEEGLVIATGGLGPTSDDITAVCAAEAAGLELVLDDSALLEVRRRVESRGRTMEPQHEKQAWLPRGSKILANAEGTAPGFAIPIGKATFMFLPGVPREMKRMFSEQVLPRVGPSAPSNLHVIRLRTFGLAESMAAQLLDGLEFEHPDVTLGYRVHFPELDVKVQARGIDRAAAHEAASVAAELVRERLGDVVYGEGDETLAWVAGRALRQKGYRLALAESCTGGLISQLLTAHSGASDFLIGGAVVYANSAKTRLIGVPEDTLRGHGAVSAEVAIAMAQGVRRTCEVDIGLSVTGIAGPAGGSTQKPVGLVYWALAHADGVIVRERVFRGDRNEIQINAAHSALDLIRRSCNGLAEGADVPMSQRPPIR